MPIIDYFTDEKTTSTIIKRNEINSDETTGDHTNTTSTIATVLSIFYTGAIAEALMAEKIREKADAVCIVDPGTNVKIKDFLTIASKDYNVEYVDDVAFQGEAVVLTVSEVA